LAQVLPTGPDPGGAMHDPRSKIMNSSIFSC
jgi:hypothetical protein